MEHRFFSYITIGSALNTVDYWIWVLNSNANPLNWLLTRTIHSGRCWQSYGCRLLLWQNKANNYMMSVREKHQNLPITPGKIEILINIRRHNRKFFKWTCQAFLPAPPDGCIRSDICIQFHYLRPVSGLSGWGIDNCSPVLFSSVSTSETLW